MDGIPWWRKPAIVLVFRRLNCPAGFLLLFFVVRTRLFVEWESDIRGVSWAISTQSLGNTGIFFVENNITNGNEHPDQPPISRLQWRIPASFCCFTVVAVTIIFRVIFLLENESKKDNYFPPIRFRGLFVTSGLGRFMRVLITLRQGRFSGLILKTIHISSIQLSYLAVSCIQVSPWRFRQCRNTSSKSRSGSKQRSLVLDMTPSKQVPINRRG